MTILSSAEVPFKRSGSVSGAECREKRLIKLVSNTPYESIYTLYSSGFVPAYLSQHPQNPFSYLKSFDYSQPEALSVYLVTCNYDSLPITQEDRDRAEQDPTLRRAKTRWDKRKETIPMDRDINGSPIVNAAGEYFDPPPEKTVTIWMLRVDKNVSSRPLWLTDYEDAVNDADLTLPGGYVIPSGCAKFQIDDLGDEASENGIDFYVFKYSLEFKKRPPNTNCRDGTDPTSPLEPDGWSLVALNQGLKQFEGTDLVNMKDDADADVTSPLPLDDDGTRIVEDDGDAMRAAILWLVWDQYESKDLSILPL